LKAEVRGRGGEWSGLQDTVAGQWAAGEGLTAAETNRIIKTESLANSGYSALTESIKQVESREKEHPKAEAKKLAEDAPDERS
jgi:hypothetical protein